jgi:hypothetical protein
MRRRRDRSSAVPGCRTIDGEVVLRCAARSLTAFLSGTGRMMTDFFQPQLFTSQYAVSQEGCIAAEIRQIGLVAKTRGE